MEINLVDRSNYFRGLLILTKKKYTVSNLTRNKIKQIAAVLDFNHAFVDTTLNELNRNKNIPEIPPCFNDRRLAELFLKDGIRIAFMDGSLNFDQITWLTDTAETNNLSKQWFFIELEDYIDNYNSIINDSFELQKYVTKDISYPIINS